MLLFVATLATLYTANTSVREQQVSANQLRADQALSAANAGLDYAFAYYSKNSGPDANGDLVIDTVTNASVSPKLVTSQPTGNDRHSAIVTFTDGDPLTDRDGDGNFTNDAFDRPHRLRSVGFSDDGSATRTIEVQLDMFGLTPAGGLPGFPLIAKGIAASGGNFSIINRFSNATVWTGAAASALGSAETYIADPLNPPVSRDDYISISGSPDPDLILHASYNKAGLNSDVIEADHNLANMTDDEFFQSFMREDKETIEAFAAGIGQRFIAGNKSWGDLVGLRGVVWIEGDWSPSGQMPVIGSEQYPITLIVNGDFRTTGGGAPEIRIIGLLYVVGDWDSSGNFAIQGGAIVEGDVDSTGTPTIVYDENLYDGSLGLPPGSIAATLAGTWRDW